MALAAARAPSDRQEKAGRPTSAATDPASYDFSWAAYEAALFVQALYGQDVGFARFLTLNSRARL
jgi:hypothetical protein